MTLMGLIDGKEFVFLDVARRPYLCRLWDGNPWLFYRHKSAWLSLRPLKWEEIPEMESLKLSDEERQSYFADAI